MQRKEEKPHKSQIRSFILTLLLGPIGLFYSSLKGGIIMTIIEVIVIAATQGVGILLTRPISILWGALSVYLHNNDDRFYLH